MGRTTPQPEGSHLFTEDGKGDYQNLAYGSIHRYSIPRYHLVGRGRVVGLDPHFRITSKSDRRREVSTVGADSSRRLRKDSLLSRHPEESPVVVRPSKEGVSDHDRGNDYLRLESHRSRKRRRISHQLGEGPAWTMASQAESGSVSGSDSESEHETSQDQHYEHAFDVFKSDPIQQRHLELARATTEHPEDAEAWRSFIQHQERSFNDTGQAAAVPAAKRRSIVDLKLSLYEQALSKVPEGPGRERLVVEMMREGRSLWDARQQAAEWRKVLGKNSSFALWVLYLDFQQTNPLNFSYEQCVEVYTACLRNLQAAPQSASRDAHCLYVLLRVSLLIQQSGYPERAIAIWQALLEYNCFRPLSLTPSDLLLSFEQFWESEAARIGEEGAEGWCSNPGQKVEPKSNDWYSQPSATTWDGWAKGEAKVSEKAGMPARTTDDIAEDDPYRVVLFADVKDFLYSPTTEAGRAMLLDAFLIFSHSAPLSTVSEPRMWSLDPFIFREGLQGVGPNQHGEISHTAPAEMSLLPATSVVCSTQSIWSSTIPGLCSPNSPPFMTDWRKRVLRQLMSKFPENESLAEYVIALEASGDLKAARKLAKSILKDRADSLRLYDAYALIEARLDHFESAEKVWSTALSMRGSLGKDTHQDGFQLWHSWVWECIRRKLFNKAAALLSMITDSDVDMSKLPADSDETGASPIDYLKAEQQTKSRLNFYISTSDHGPVPILADLLSLQKYFAARRSLEAALEVYESTFAAWQPKNDSVSLSTALEILHQYRGRLLHVHASLSGKNYKPKQVAASLAASLRAFPSNLLLLSLHRHYAQKCGLIDRIHNPEFSIHRMDNSTNEDRSVVPAIFSLADELARPAYSGSTENTVRSAFSHATSPYSPARHSVPVWRAYVLWETSFLHGRDISAAPKIASRPAKNQDPMKRAKEVFYASLRACPWSKDLHMLGFSHTALREGIGQEGLKDLYQSMQDRNLRIRLDISQKLDVGTRG